MDIVQSNQVVALRHDAHELARVLLPGPGDRRRPPGRPGLASAASRVAMAARHQQRLHERPRLGARLRDQRRDDRLVLLRDARLRRDARDRRRLVHLLGRRRHQQGRAGAELRATARRPTTPARPARRRPRTRSPPTAATPIRNALYQALVYATLAGGHSVINGTAPAGATLKITKDFNLYTNRITQQHDAGRRTGAAGRSRRTSSPRCTVPANGQLHVERQPVRAPEPAVPRRGHGPRPERLPAGELDAHLHGCPTARWSRRSRSRSTRARRRTCRSARRAASAARCRRRWR